jgi:hypothetical protein
MKEKISSLEQEKRFFCLTGPRIFSNQPADSQTTDAFERDERLAFERSEQFYCLRTF